MGDLVPVISVILAIFKFNDHIAVVDIVKEEYRNLCSAGQFNAFQICFVSSKSLFQFH